MEKLRKIIGKVVRKDIFDEILEKGGDAHKYKLAVEEFATFEFLRKKNVI